MDRRIFLASALAIGGCAGIPPTIVPSQPSMTELEPLYRAEAGRAGLSLSVASNGCTTRDDFAVYAERRPEGVCLAFGRRRIDTCRSFAMGRTDLVFTWRELGIEPRSRVILLNPLVAWTGPGG